MSSARSPPGGGRIIADCIGRRSAPSLFTLLAETGLRMDRGSGADPQMAREALLLVGPNCMGTHNRRLGVRLAQTSDRRAGNVGFISQSALTINSRLSARCAA
jgi:hypothetical protein